MRACADFETKGKRTLASACSRFYPRQMPRRRRIEIPDAYYHVVTRGNDRQPIYFGNWSGRLFVRELERASLRNGWRVLAYCLMTNHYHLVLQIGDGGLSRGMCELNGRFAQITNWANKRSDHLFGGRFRDRLIEGDGHLLEVCRYVVLNPVRAPTGCRDASRWRWSSHAPALGLVRPPECLDVGWLLGHFGRNPARARAQYAAFVDAGLARSQVPGTDTGVSRATNG
jgi:putative transposase